MEDRYKSLRPLEWSCSGERNNPKQVKPATGVDHETPEDDVVAFMPHWPTCYV